MPDGVTPVTPALDAGTHIRLPRHRIERRAIVWWMLQALFVWGAILAALIASAVLWESMRVWLIAPIVIASVMLLATLFVEPLWRYHVHRWEVTEHATYATSGWLVREWRVSPISRIQTVDAVRGPLEQLLGLSTLRVTTASSYGAIKIHGLDHVTAAEAATQLAIVAEVSEGDAT
ncbi:MAG: PH domain-containing protein [Ruaniaceae bacterium]|nr:PH domain-containing protein [Ruaniaceae bacterium]